VIASWFRFSGTFRGPMTAPGLPPLFPTGLSLVRHGSQRDSRQQRTRHQIFWDIAELSGHDFINVVVGEGLRIALLNLVV
jgi:hypothetical protein